MSCIWLPPNATLLCGVCLYLSCIICLCGARDFLVDAGQRRIIAYLGISPPLCGKLTRNTLTVLGANTQSLCGSGCPNLVATRAQGRHAVSVVFGNGSLPLSAGT